jgi:itaconate CoA-transferase
MMDFRSIYESKLTTPEAAVGRIASGVNVSMGMAMTEPPALLKALADRAAAGRVDNLKLYYFESTRIAGETVLRYELTERIQPYSMFVTDVEHALIKRGEQDGRKKVLTYVPSNFSQSPRILTEHIGIDTFLVTVSSMDEHGYLTFGTGNDYSSKVARAAKHLIVEVNNQMPRVYGSLAELHVSEVEAIVENNAPLLELPVHKAAAEDPVIGKMVAEMVPNGACLQMGVGALPDLVCAQLRDRKDLGIHTEALCPRMIDLINGGAVTNRRKRLNQGKTVFTFAMGQKAMHPVDYVNDPGVISQNESVISINAALQIDLTGAVNAEHMLGHQYSATGGQLDFVRGAYASRGGKSIIACHSTAAQGKVSRIVARMDGPVTTPRIDTHIVVTEFGWTDLKGKSSTERAKALGQKRCTCCKYRNQMRKQARRGYAC